MSSFKTKAALGVRPMVLPDIAGIRATPVHVDFSDAGASLAVNEIVELCELPPGVQVMDYDIAVEDIDSNGNPTVAFSFGVLNAAGTDLAEVWATAITQGQTGGVFRATTTNHLASSAVAARKLGLKVTAAPATPALTGKSAWATLHLRA